MLIQWPTEFPPEALDITISALRGQPVEAEYAARCVYHVAGYGAGKFFGSSSGPLLGSPAAVLLSREETAAALEALKSPSPNRALPSIDWSKLVPVLMVLLQELLKGK